MKTTDTATATAFLLWEASLGPPSQWTLGESKERLRRFKELSPEDKYLIKRSTVDKYFVDSNALKERQSRCTSPSGKYILITTPYHTKGGSWEYTLGEVFRTPIYPETEPVKIAEVRRNYSAMWFTWVEGHPITGMDYLLTGEDYQGFTTVNLTTNKVSSYIPDDAFAGHGWCPMSAEIFGHGALLKVSGCYWACPYEVRIYDFSDPDALDFPEKGLPVLVSIDEQEGTLISIEEDGTLVCTQRVKRFKLTGEWELEVDQRRLALDEREHKAKKRGDAEELARVVEEIHKHDMLYYPEEDAEYDRVWGWEPYTRKVYVRQGQGLYCELPTQEWKSEYALACERQAEVNQQKAAADFKHYVDVEPLYQLMKKEWPEDHLSRTGQQWPSLMNRWDGDDNPFYFYVRVGDDAVMVWGADHGPITVTLYDRGSVKAEFPRTDEGWYRALSYARKNV